VDSVTKKCCATCKKWLERNAFAVDKNRADGLLLNCRACQRIYRRDYYATHKQQFKRYARKNYLGHTEAYFERSKQCKMRHGYPHEWSVATMAQHRRINHVQFLFSTAELEQRVRSTPCCELCGRQLSWEYGHGSVRQDSPSLDNRDLKSVLAMTDVMILCNFCNLSKNRRTFDELVAWCQDVVDKFGTPAAKLRVA